jgi:regulator of protease activity HflC (stomatin/prohibitin superfamily)
LQFNPQYESEGNPMKIDVMQNERVFVLFDGRPAKYLGPGRYSLFKPFTQVRLERVSVTGLIADLDAERLKLVPAEDLTLVTNAPHERAIVYRKGKAAQWLGAGAFQVWTIDRTVDRATGQVTSQVRIDKLDLSGVETRPLKDDAKAIAPASDYVETTAPEGSVALRYVDGHLDAQLPAGRHAAFTALHKVSFAVIDLKERLINVVGQEVMTKDRLTLRLNVAAAFQVADAKRLATVARNPDEVLYLAIQLAAREAVGSRTLDELLAARDVFATAISEAVAARAETVGLKLVELGLKDVVLPGDMKELLNKVIQAQKEAEANVILRREETAATRSLAQTAKVLAENPLLVRLKELEAYKDLAAKVGQVHLVLGQEQLPKLEIKT